MRIVRKLLGLVSAITLIIIVLLTCVQVAVYSDMGFYEKEYTKYQVTDDVHMEMSDLMYVTTEMLDYMIGNRENLNVTTTVNGQQREFFNEREISHMEDVRNLFVGGLQLRRICIIIFLIGLLLLKFVCKGSIRRDFAGVFLWVFGIFIVVGGAIAFYLSQNFTKGFTYFHKILFTNDLWILDPNTDLLINIVPEPFFVDMAARIGIIFGISMLVLLVISIILFVKRVKPRTHNSGYRFPN